MRSINIKTAELSNFVSKEPKAYCGDALATVKTLEISIFNHGLLNPLIVNVTEGGLVVIEGRKRLMAIRRLKVAGKLPRDLHRIPYVEIGEHVALSNEPLALLSNRDKFMEVGRLHTQGCSIREIASRLYTPVQTIRELLSVAKLSRKLQTEFLTGHLTLKQARAFATLPNTEAQDALMQVLGPFAQEPEIIRSIYSGETVLNIDNEDVIILPSRKPLEHYDKAA